MIYLFFLVNECENKYQINKRTNQQYKKCVSLQN